MFSLIFVFLNPDPDLNEAKIWIRIQIQCIWIQNTAYKLPILQLYSRTLDGED